MFPRIGREPRSSIQKLSNRDIMLPTMGPGAKRKSLAPLADHLTVLASSVRLTILRELVEPKHVGDIRVVSVGTDGETARPISRQATAQHVERLVEAGLVRRTSPGRDARKGPGYTVAQDRLFALVDELRELTCLRPVMDAAPAIFATQAASADAPPSVAPRPRLVIAYGPSDRLALPLEGAGPWSLGRAGDASVMLDHDPFASAEHAVIERSDDGWRVTDQGSSNGTWLNWERLDAGASRPLQAGDLITAGRTQLVFQP